MVLVGGFYFPPPPPPPTTLFHQLINQSIVSFTVTLPQSLTSSIWLSCCAKTTAFGHTSKTLCNGNDSNKKTEDVYIDFAEINVYKIIRLQQYICLEIIALAYTNRGLSVQSKGSKDACTFYTKVVFPAI